MSMYDMAVFMPICEPVFVYPVTGPELIREHRLHSAGARTGGRMRAGFEPVYWGGEKSILMLDGNYRVPIRGYRYVAFLTLEYLAPNDYGLLNRWAMDASLLGFYPYGIGRGKVDVYIHPESLVWSHERSGINTARASFELRGNKLLSADNIAEEFDIIDPHAWRVDLTGGLPTWSLVIRWYPLVTAGILIFKVYDITTNNILDEKNIMITAGTINFALSSEPSYIMITHSLTGFMRRIDL